MTIITIGPDTPKYRTRISNEAKDCLRDYDTSKFEGRLAASPTVNEMSTPSRIGLALAASIMSGEASMPVTTAPRRHIRGQDYHQGRPEPTDCPWANAGVEAKRAFKMTAVNRRAGVAP